jgi:lysophospholipase L1-like esterase
VSEITVRNPSKTSAVRTAGGLVRAGRTADVDPTDPLVIAAIAAGKLIDVAAGGTTGAPTATPGTFRGLWAPRTVYNPGDLALYSGQLYSALLGFTSGATFNPANWVAITSRNRGRGSAQVRALAKLSKPAAMAVPPTITSNAGASGATPSASATTIAGGVLIPWTDARFRYSAPLGLFNGYGRRHVTVGAPPGTQTGVRSAPTLQSFAVDAQVFELALFGDTGAKFRIAVDGVWHSLTPAPIVAANDAKHYLVKVDLGSKALRSIMVEGTDFARFGGVVIGPADALLPPLHGSGLRMAVLTDSYGYTVPAGFAADAFGYQLGLMLGTENVDILAAGSTGVIANAAGAQPTYRQRAKLDLYPNKYDVVLVPGSVNDSNAPIATGGAFGPELGTLLDEILASQPTADVFTTSTIRPTGPAAVPTDATISALIAAEAAKRPRVQHIDAIGGDGPAWFTGNGAGKVGATNGSGNGDVYLSNDGVHPSPAGHAYLAANLARRIGDRLGLAVS